MELEQQIQEILKNAIICFDFVRLVREIQPRYVLFENVPGMFTE